MRNGLIINALQNLLFCIPKAAVLHGKSVGFALQNSRFRNAKSKLAFFVGIIFTKAKIKQLYYNLIHNRSNTSGGRFLECCSHQAYGLDFCSY
ncbi:hypothetical protein CTM58_12455 [Prevotella intermedia]|uniref:Uncharacterized protein n=1 Tax=Prevotella intermedia TaxID=28131 RepID=A0A2M8TRE0_PREIN|nr:hypothetical protein CTM58_12455 [Prevotella intermedia]